MSQQMLDYNLYEKILNKFPTKRGLFFVILLCFFSIKAVISNWDTFVIVYFVAIFIIFFIWLILSHHIFYKSSSKINIIIALHTNWESIGFLFELKKLLIRELNENAGVKIVFFPEDRYFKSELSAEKYAHKKKIDLLIWGECIKTKKSLKIDIKYTHYFQIFNMLIRKMGFEEARKSLGKSIGDGSPISDIIINEEYSLDEVEKTAQNVSSISLFIIARSIATKFTIDSFEKALEILNSLLNKSKLLEKKFKDTIKSTCLTFREIVCIILAEKLDYLKLEIAAKELLKQDQNNIIALLNLIKIEWLKGNPQDSKRYFKTAKKLKPGYPPLILDEAFFLLNESDYRKAIQKIKSIGDPRCNIIEVISFYLDEYEKTKKEQMLFGAGFINIQFEVDKITGIELLKDFVKNVANTNNFTILVELSKRLIIQNE